MTPLQPFGVRENAGPFKGFSPTGGRTDERMAEASRLVLDTSAVLAMRSNEPGADRVEKLLRLAQSGSSTIFVSFMTRMELLYRITIDEGHEQAEAAVRLLDASGVEWVSCEPAILEEAARLKAGGGLSVADAWVAATASLREAVLVHKDPEFKRAAGVRQEHVGR
jgi:ribonuclease VapC